MIISDINKLNYSDGSKAIQQLLNSQISDKELFEIIYLNDKTIVAEFLEEYSNFTEKQCSIIENYIEDYPLDGDIMFLSDLIDFANIWSLNLNYRKYLPFLKNSSKEMHLVVLSLICYIHNNFKYYYFREVKELLENVMNNSNFMQNVQISAAFCLFRHTHKKSYIEEIEGWMDNDFNTSFINNTLENMFYTDEFFSIKRKKKILKIISGGGNVSNNPN